MALKKNNRGAGGVAFDAASGSGLAFLSSQLESCETDLVKPLTSMTHDRDITVKFGGGFVEFLTAYQSDYATTGGNEYGLQGTNNNDIPVVQTSVGKGVWKAWNWAAGMFVSYIDLKRLQNAQKFGQAAPVSLTSMLEDAVQLVWNKAMEKVTYLGWLGQPGIINNPNVTSSLAPATGSGGLRTWASKTPTQIQTDVNFGLTQTVNQSAFSLDGMADTILISWAIYPVLMQPMTTGGFSSVLEFILKNNIARENGIDLKIFPVANDWITGQGAGSTERAVFYRNNAKVVQLRAPQPVTKMATIPKDSGWKSVYNGCIGQVQWLRTQPAYYLDAIG